MIRVLVVEDDAIKYGRLYQVLTSNGVEASRIAHAISASAAVEQLGRGRYDLMLLDINLPRRLGEGPQRGGGMQVLREIGRDDRLDRPAYVVGVTAFEDLVGEFGPEFEEQLWSVVHYSESTDRWIAQLASKLRYIAAAKASRRFSDGVTFGCDLFVVTALESPEHEAVMRLPLDWSPLRLSHDETRYASAAFTCTGGTTRSIIAAAAPRMGMPAAAVLSSKAIQQFRPRYIAMVGICAGRSSEVSLGDLIVADPTFDWGSGKIQAREGAPRFLPDPHQLDLDPDVAEALKEIAADKGLLAAIKDQYPGSKPTAELRMHVGPLASGAAVVTDPSLLAELLERHRKLLGIEMEGYGVAAAARGNGRPRPQAFVVKGVSDFADSAKADDLQPYAAHNSARCVLEAARRLLGTYHPVENA